MGRGMRPVYTFICGEGGSDGEVVGSGDRAKVNRAGPAAGYRALGVKVGKVRHVRLDERRACGRVRVPAIGRRCSLDSAGPPCSRWTLQRHAAGRATRAVVSTHHSTAQVASHSVGKPPSQLLAGWQQELQRSKNQQRHRVSRAGRRRVECQWADLPQQRHWRLGEWGGVEGRGGRSGGRGGLTWSAARTFERAGPGRRATGRWTGRAGREGPPRQPRVGAPSAPSWRGLSGCSGRPSAEPSAEPRGEVRAASHLESTRCFSAARFRGSKSSKLNEARGC